MPLALRAHMRQRFLAEEWLLELGVLGDLPVEQTVLSITTFLITQDKLLQTEERAVQTLEQQGLRVVTAH